MSDIKVVLHYKEVQGVIEELGKVEIQLEREKEHLHLVDEKLRKLYWKGENAERYYQKLKEREKTLEDIIMKIKKTKKAIISVVKNLKDAEETVRQFAESRVV